MVLKYRLLQLFVTLQNQGPRAVITRTVPQCMIQGVNTLDDCKLCQRTMLSSDEFIEWGMTDRTSIAAAARWSIPPCLGLRYGATASKTLLALIWRIHIISCGHPVFQ